MRARLGTAAHLCRVVVLTIRFRAKREQLHVNDVTETLTSGPPLLTSGDEREAVSPPLGLKAQGLELRLEDLGHTFPAADYRSDFMQKARVELAFGEEREAVSPPPASLQ